MDFPLPFFFFKLRFYGLDSVTLADYAQWQPETAKSLQFILDFEDSSQGGSLEEIVCRTFSVDVQIGNESKTVDLVPGGSEIYVSAENREQFVHLFI